MENPLSLHVGDLNAWPRLKRSIQSYGLLLYGPYSEFPERMKPYLLFRLTFSKLSRAQKVGAWRKMYGYTQKIGKKKYEKRGVIESLGGKKLAKSIVLVPVNTSQDFKTFLAKNSISFLVHEIWSDTV